MVSAATVATPSVPATEAVSVPAAETPGVAATAPGADTLVTAPHACVTTVREAPCRLAMVDVQRPTAKGRTEALVATPELLARLRSTLVESSMTLLRGDATKGHAAAVDRIEMPVVVDDVRPVETVEAVDIDVDVVAVPVEATPQGEACSDADAPEKSIDQCSARRRTPVGRIVGRVAGPPPRAVYER